MNTFRKLLKQIGKWYRRLFIEIPEGYGDPVSPAVEKFQEELIDPKLMKNKTVDNLITDEHNQKIRLN